MLLPSIPPTHVFSAMKITMKWAIVSKKKKKKVSKSNFKHVNERKHKVSS